jgi:hypothetical protein
MSDSTIDQQHKHTITKLRGMIGTNIGNELLYHVDYINGNLITYRTFSQIKETVTLEEFEAIALIKSKSIAQMLGRIFTNISNNNKYYVENINGNRITYRMLSPIIQTRLDDFLKLKISAKNKSNAWKLLPIGEAYNVFPDRDDDDDDDSYAEKVDSYCLELNKFMETQGSLNEELPTPKGGRKTYHKRNNKKKKRTYKRRK